MAGDLEQALGRLTGARRALAIADARLAYRGGFATALAVAALGAGIAALLVAWLMRQRH